MNLFGGVYEVFQDERGDGWYAFGFLLGAASPFMGFFGRGSRKKREND